MKIDVDEIHKITLAENEILVFKIPRGVLASENFDKYLKLMQENISKNLKRRVLMIDSEIEITKVTDEPDKRN